MKRNAVKSGLFDQRDRATQRRRSRREQAASAREDDFAIWLEAWGFRDQDIGSIDLTEYFRDSSCFDTTASEKLRRLAVHLEPVAFAMGLAGWAALRRIYDHALRLEPENPELLVSMAISACDLADGLSDSPEKERIFAAGEAAARQAVELAPESADSHQALGYLLYFRGRKQAALDALERALECAADGPAWGWAQLYRAHCLHDMERWEEALAAYDDVDLSSFGGPGAWRVDVLAEQMALCLHQVGRIEEAHERLLAILDRYQREPHVAFRAMSASLWQLAAAVSPEILERAEAIDRAALDRAMLRV